MPHNPEATTAIPPLSPSQAQVNQALQEVCFGEECLIPLRKHSHNLTLARGTFGDVALGLLSSPLPNGGSDGRSVALCACKTMVNAWKVHTGHLLPAVRAEISALRSLGSHPNIVSLHAVVAKEAASSMALPSLTLVMNFCPIDLYVFLEHHRRGYTGAAAVVPWSVVYSVAHDLQCALQHCHSHDVVHADVKPGNLLLEAQTGRWQLADFGICHHLSAAEVRHSDDTAVNSPLPTALGTLYYRAPEVLLGAPGKDSAVDLWAAGCVAAEVINGGRPLFQGSGDLAQLSAIFEGLGTPSSADEVGGADLARDWGKLSFAVQSGLSWSALVPRVTEASPHAAILVPWLQSLVRLHPRQRHWSQTVPKDMALDRAAVVRECELLPPPLLLYEAPRPGENPADATPPPVAHMAAWAKQRRMLLSTAAGDASIWKG